MAAYSKYYKQQKQVSYDSGNTWENLNEYQKGELIENDSSDCGYVGQLERWVNTGTTCEGYDKYYIQVKEISDDGVNWSATSETQLGNLIERNSTDCGYIHNYHYFATYYGGATRYDDCNDSSGSIQQIFPIEGLLTFYIGKCADFIASGVFARQQGMTSTLSAVTIDEGLKTIGSIAFQDCNNLKIISIPSTVIEINERAFYGCSGLTDVYIASLSSWCGITFGDYYANPISFAEHIYVNGAEVTDLVIPGDISSISKYAFKGCKAITSVTINSNISIISSFAFYDCSNLQSITVNSTTKPYLYGNHPEETFAKTNNCPIYVPAASVNAYKSDSRWSTYASRIQAIPT